MKRHLLALSLVAALAPAAQADIITHNPSDYFNDLIDAGTTQQTTDQLWQFGYLNSNSEFTLFNYTADMSNGEPNNFGNMDFYKNYRYYGFGVNRSGGSLSVFNDSIESNEIYAHPGDFNGGDVILRYVAQQSTEYNLAAVFTNLHYGTVDYGIDLSNGTSLASGTITNSQFSQNFSFSLNQGDFIDFTIDRSNGSWAGDSVGMLTNVSFDNSTVAVSEPATALMMLGAGALLFRRRKQS